MCFHLCLDLYKLEIALVREGEPRRQGCAEGEVWLKDMGGVLRFPHPSALKLLLPFKGAPGKAGGGPFFHCFCKMNLSVKVIF